MTELHAHLDQCASCRQEWTVYQSTLLLISTTSQPLLDSHQSQQMWQQCEARLSRHQKASAPVLSRRAAQPDFFNPPLGAFLSWARLQPPLGWAALGGAAAILGSAWVFSTAEPGPALQPARMAFQMPPRDTIPLVDHHAAMATDPFTDHVGATMVSYSASQATH